MFPLGSNYPVRGPTPVTWTIIALCGGIALLQALQDPPFATATLLRFGVTPALVTFDLWPWNADSPHILLTLVSSLFVHASLWHVVGNMLFFHCFSQPVELLMGSWRYALFFLGCGVAGGLGHALANPSSAVPVVGASGAVAGVLAAHAVLLPWTRIRVRASLTGSDTLPAWVFLAAWTALQAVPALDMASPVAWMAHVGGVVAGLLLAPLFSRPGVLVMAPTPGTDDATEHGPGIRVATLPAALLAGLLVAGAWAWLAGLQQRAAPDIVLAAKRVIARHRVAGLVVPRQPDSALALYREAAAGNPYAALELARALDRGGGLPTDRAEAVRWYARAAEAGIDDARFAYAVALLDGDTVARDSERGLAMLRLLARGNAPAAQAELARRLETGTATTAADPVEAAQAYRALCNAEGGGTRDRKAALQACTRLALMLFAGKGVPADRDESIRLLERAAAQNYPPAQNALGLWLAADDPEATEFDDKVRPGDSRARGLFLMAAIARDPDGMYDVARIEERRPGPFPMSDADKRTWYERSAAAGNARAIRRLQSP